jgi:SAM-dependent methyltransferase
MSNSRAIEDWVENALTENQYGVLVEGGHESIDYSDGRESEQYLEKVFASSNDLSSTSAELENWIKDWPSEYHLSRRRSQLLRGFEYSPASTVLEVGCGCGAITRFLGETFNHVVAVEGAAARARLARQRCRDLDNVDVVCAPFQDIRFREKFDIIFCIGVFEYSHYFIDGDDPYSGIIDYFSQQLKPGGILMLAIENQFGLKYFASASEDHSGIRYDGLEGYPRGRGKARTFGGPELRQLLQQRFSKLDFYFPLPDYKLVDGLVSESALSTIDVTELMGRFVSRDYGRPYRPRFSERNVWREIVRNGQLPLFANSFLVTARKEPAPAKRDAAESLVNFDQLALIYNRDRAESYHTLLKIQRDQESGARVEKSLLQDSPQDDYYIVPYTEPWVVGESLHSKVLRQAQSENQTLEQIFHAVAPWFSHLKGVADEGGLLPGGYIDAIWQNSFVVADGVRFIDLEWHSRERISVKTLLIRSVYRFLVDLRSCRSYARILRNRTSKTLIREVALLMGEPVAENDINRFIAVEAKLHSLVTGGQLRRSTRHIRLVLWLPQRSGVWLVHLAVCQQAFDIYRGKAARLVHRVVRLRG